MRATRELLRKSRKGKGAPIALVSRRRPLMRTKDGPMGLGVAAIALFAAGACGSGRARTALAAEDAGANFGAEDAGTNTGTFQGAASKSCATSADCPAGYACETSMEGEFATTACVPIDAGVTAVQDAGSTRVGPEADGWLSPMRAHR